ncbi:hypothetical protein F5Y18DRAFT_259050 [Xylariaceae sp. FL1019]|nr:hypothetical protein F5Y18DRAFT_259050 [Xylariaceae sp. FL1019]
MPSLMCFLPFWVASPAVKSQTRDLHVGVPSKRVMPSLPRLVRVQIIPLKSPSQDLRRARRKPLACTHPARMAKPRTSGERGDVLGGGAERCVTRLGPVLVGFVYSIRYTDCSSFISQPISNADRDLLYLVLFYSRNRHSRSCVVHGT